MRSTRLFIFFVALMLSVSFVLAQAKSNQYSPVSASLTGNAFDGFKKQMYPLNGEGGDVLPSGCEGFAAFRLQVNSPASIDKKGKITYKAVYTVGDNAPQVMDTVRGDNLWKCEVEFKDIPQGAFFISFGLCGVCVGHERPTMDLRLVRIQIFPGRDLRENRELDVPFTSVELPKGLKDRDEIMKAMTRRCNEWGISPPKRTFWDDKFDSEEAWEKLRQQQEEGRQKIITVPPGGQTPPQTPPLTPPGAPVKPYTVTTTQDGTLTVTANDRDIYVSFGGVELELWVDDPKNPGKQIKQDASRLLIKKGKSCTWPFADLSPEQAAKLWIIIHDDTPGPDKDKTLGSIKYKEEN
jgi:hypothetical protein